MIVPLFINVYRISTTTEQTRPVVFLYINRSSSLFLPEKTHLLYTLWYGHYGRVKIENFCHHEVRCILLRPSQRFCSSQKRVLSTSNISVTSIDPSNNFPRFQCSSPFVFLQLKFLTRHLVLNQYTELFSLRFLFTSRSYCNSFTKY